MARGTQHLKKRPKQAVQPPRQRPRGEARRQRRMEETGMFFPALRRHAKWVFVLLAVVFAGGFIFFGVGSGSNGIGDILQNWLNVGKGSAPSTTKLEAKVRAHPTDAQAYRDLASAYEGGKKTDRAVVALAAYTKLRPKDSNALQELAGLYQQQLSDLSARYTAIQVAPVATTTDLVPPTSTKIGQAYAALLADPIDQAVQGYGSQQQSQISQDANAVARKIEGTYKRLVALDPTDATARIQLAQAAQSIGDTALAISSYTRAKKLDPSYASLVDQQLKQLQPTSSTTTTTPSASKPKRK